MDDAGYINFFEILGLEPNANPGEVRKTYRREMKRLVGEIAQAKITEDRRAEYILEMAKMNGAVYVLRDKAMREEYETERNALIELERQWRELAEKDSDPEKTDPLRREFDGRVKAFLSKYVEETMLEAGQDKEVAEASNWNILHSRYALKHLRHYRHRLYHDILERLPYHQVTKPSIDWEERKKTVSALLETTA